MELRVETVCLLVFRVENDVKEDDALSPLLFNVAQKYATRKVQETRFGLDINGLCG